MTDSPAPDLEAHKLACSEVWGGNRATDELVDVDGISALVHSRTYAGDESGGDLYYVSTCGSGRVSRFALADVSGHGKPVSELAIWLRNQMRRNVHQLNVARLAVELNRELSAKDSEGRFATALLATYFAPRDHLVICNAGHPRPLWRQASSGAWKLLDHREPSRAGELLNLPLGVIVPTDYHQFAIRLEPDDLVLLYTDAFIEVEVSPGQRLGEAGFMELVASIEPDEPRAFAQAIIDAFLAAYGEPEDDQTLLVLRHTATDPEMGMMMRALAPVARMLGIVDY